MAYFMGDDADIINVGWLCPVKDDNTLRLPPVDAGYPYTSCSALNIGTTGDNNTTVKDEPDIVIDRANDRVELALILCHKLGGVIIGITVRNRVRENK